jgi:2,4-dienoyl-CoA reductase-like NADH-dependent reductase (Old Yellow Enzyme family)
VRQVLPDGDALFVRISGTDWADGGWTPDDSVALVRQLMPLGADVCDCSSGGLVPSQRIPVGAGYQVPLAERIKREAGIPTAAVGLITAPEQAEQIVRSGQADLIVMARELLRDPYWPIHAAVRLRQEPEVPPQYLRAF